MDTNSKHLEEVAEFIKGHRGNESAFQELYSRLLQEAELPTADAAYKSNLLEIKEKAAQEYIKAKEIGGSAWPEFEKFVTGFEKAVLQNGT